MAWLVTHMWMVLAGATVFALLLGWSVRGMLLTGKMRKAIVDKDVALTELDQARDEIERLFAAQRAQRGEGGNVADASARKISDLTSELQKAKTELATLKTESAKASAAASAAPAADTDAPTIVLPPNRGGAEDASGQVETAPSAGTADDDAEAPTLVWRNRHLEARVQHLESQLAERAAAPAAPVVVAEAIEPQPATEPSVDEAGLDKLKWQADYLKQRVEALEAELAKAPAEAPVLADEDLNEEMARLRWRNRFLEGRLAYFEGGAEDAAAETVAEPTGAEAMLEELEVTDTAADMTEAVEAMAEDISAAETFEDVEAEPVYEEPAVEVQAEDEVIEDVTVEELEIIEEEIETADEDAFAEVSEDEAETEEDSFEDVSDDEEESLAEADHADEDVLSDEEYDEEDFIEEDQSDEEFDAEADEADEVDDEDDYEEDDTDEQDESYDEESYEDESDEDESDEDGEVEDEYEDDADEDSDDDEEGESEDDDADEAYDDSEDEFEADADDEDGSDEESDEFSDEADDAEDDAEDEGDFEEEDESVEDEVSYETEETVLTERPMAMSGPVEGHPDDLTLIGGIGPKIQVLLNELGVWHYDQIAEWTPENVAWMDEHLNFGGRIAREGWVEQAAVLVRDAESV
ncbi:hypothetical protein [Hyphomonas sp.]|uniref:hypothetical protein n=1 Tax=Hyphomonas sp. TaxID=87 RepID=UPI003527A12B